MRSKNSGSENWNYIPTLLESQINPLLEPSILGLLESATEKKMYLRRRLFSKKSLPGNWSDIAMRWHRDRDENQLTLMLLLSDTGPNTPHTQCYKPLSKLFVGKDPRQSRLARVALMVKKVIQQPVSITGKRGDLLLLMTNRLIHKVSIPETGENRLCVFASYSSNLHTKPKDGELISQKEKRVLDSINENDTNSHLQFLMPY